MIHYNGTAGLVLEALRAYDLQGENGQYRSNSPFRAGSNSHGFAVTIHDDEHGAYQDHVSGEKGSLYQLAERLGVNPAGSRASASSSSQRAYTDLADYLEARAFWREPPRSPHEFARLRSGRGAVVVLYHSCTVLVQGQHQQQTMAQLGILVVQPLADQGVLL